MSLVLAGWLTAAAAAAGGAGATPWDREEPCGWWLGQADGRSLRASIAQGDTGIILTLADPALNAWPEAERPTVELLFNGDPRRRVTGEGSTTHDILGQASFAIELQREDLPALAEATRVELRRDGKAVMAVPLADSPVLDELTACIRVRSEHSASE